MAKANRISAADDVLALISGCKIAGSIPKNFAYSSIESYGKIYPMFGFNFSVVVYEGNGISVEKLV